MSKANKITPQQPVHPIWPGLALIAAHGLLYLINDWPTGSQDLVLGWPLGYTFATLTLLALLYLALHPPGAVQRWLDGWLDRRHTTRLLYGAGLLFYAITATALVRKMAAGTWGASQTAACGGLILGAGLLLWPLINPTLKHAWLAIAPAGLLLRGLAMWLDPLDVTQADMLPLIEAANQTLFTGASPYRCYDMHGWPLPLPYLPGTWLAYLPAVAGGLDLRWINALAEGVVFGSLVSLNKKTTTVPLAALLYLSPIVIIYDLYTEHPIMWALMTLLLVLVIARRRWVSAIIWGVGLATSPFIWVVSPLVAIHLFHTTAPRDRWRVAMITAITALGLVLPFLLWTPQSFLYGTVTWLNDLRHVADGAWTVHGHQQLFTLGFAGWFWLAGGEWLLKPIQAGVVLALAYIYGRRRTFTAARLARTALWTYVLFVCFNVVIWPRYYAPALCLVTLALVQDRTLSPKE